MTKFETVERPKTREKMTVWMGLSNHGVFGSHFFENENEEGDTIRTENYIAMLREKVLRVLKRKQKNIIPVFPIRQLTDPSSLLSYKFGLTEGEFWKHIDVRKADFGWPSYSPDLNPADFFLWGFLKERVYLDKVKN